MKEKIVEVEVTGYSKKSGQPIVNLSQKNCLKWKITKENGEHDQPKIGQKLKIIKDW